MLPKTRSRMIPPLNDRLILQELQKMHLGRLFLAFVGVALVSVPINAHHSFTATYQDSREITIEGELVAFMLRNPHSFVHVIAPDDTGEMQRWAVEWGAASRLRGQLSRDTLKVGERVIVVGHPSRNPENFSMLLQSIKRPSDGWEWNREFN